LSTTPQIPIGPAERHIRQFFAGHSIAEHQWTLGPVPDAIPDFRVFCVGPGPQTRCWTYVSCGASSVSVEGCSKLEFFIVAPTEDLRHVELVTMVGWYHKQSTLGWGHTLPIGEPWLQHSRCDHLLISTPYPYGPELEICNFEGGQIDFLWLLPITQAEKDFKVANDVEALEQLFDDAAIEYWDASRPSVV
jgi:hypothetical protein